MIEIELPDGTIAEFPDGMPQAEIERVLAQQFGRSAPAGFSGVTGAVESTAQAPQSAPQGGIGRTLGLGARGMLEGVGSTIGILSDPLAAGADALAGAVTGEPQRIFGTAREGFSGLADRIGLPTPETPIERISGDLTGAITGGGGWLGAGRALASRAPGVIQRVGQMMASQPGTQLASAAAGSGAAGVTREQGGSESAQLAAGLLGGLGAPAAKTAGAATLRGAVRGGEAGRAAMERTINDFRQVGAQPSVGQAAGNRRMQGLESLLSGAPTSGGVMARAAERQADDIGAGLRRMADDFMPNASAERAGRAIERGAEAFAKNTRATKQALYWQADRLIPENTRVPVTNTQRALEELTALTPGAESTTAVMVNPKIATLARTLGEDVFAAQATGAGGIPYSAVKDLRSRIGQELSDYSLTTDKPTAQYKQLYAALSRDMEEAAKAQGPAAERAAKRANNYTRAAADRTEQVERVIDRNGGPERVFNAVMAGTKDGGTTLRAVMQSLPKDGQRAVTAAVIKRMGMAPPGAQDAAGEVFSSDRFLRNWNNISTEARRTLFDRHGLGFSKNMDKIARVADRIKSGSQVFANPSGTANRAAAFTYAGSLGASLLTGQVGAFGALAGGGVAANAMARWMTNPRFVSWLARSTELPVSSAPQQALTLQRIAEDEGDEEMAALAESLQNRSN